MFYRHKSVFFGMFRRAMTRHPRYPHLWAWAQQIISLVDAVYAAAEASGMDKTARQRLVLRIDHRDISMEVILAAIRHHAAAEYPYLLDHEIDHNLTALYALNLNDRYWALRLCEVLGDTPAGQAAAALRDHLNRIPDQN